MRMTVRERSGAALLAVALGLVTLVAFVAVSLWQGRIVSGAAGLPFGAAWLAPYVVALAGSLVRRTEARWPLLVGAGLAAMGQVVFWLPWGVGLIPTALLLLVTGFHQVMTVEWSGRDSWRLAAAFAGGACLVGALYLGYLKDDPRCWELTIHQDGSEQRRPVSVEAAEALGVRFGPVRVPVEVDRARGTLVVPHCIHDVLTPFDVALALSVTGAGVAILGAAAALREAAPASQPARV